MSYDNDWNRWALGGVRSWSEAFPKLDKMK